MATPNTPLWEVFIRSRNGLAHKHVGSLHASDATLALQAARDIYTRRGEGLSIWVVPSSAITASDPAEKGMMFEPAESKIYRHPTFYAYPTKSGTCDLDPHGEEALAPSRTMRPLGHPSRRLLRRLLRMRQSFRPALKGGTEAEFIPHGEEARERRLEP